MTRPRSPWTRALSALAAVTLGAAGLVMGVAAPASAVEAVVYDSIPDTLAGNYASVGFQATSTNEFGDVVTLAGAQRELTTVTVGMSSWACENWASGATPCVTSEGASFDHPITLNVYAVDTSAATPSVGALLATVTETKAIPYRPSANTAACGDNRWSNGTTCFNGYAFTLAFDLGGVEVPDQVIVSVAYSTQTRGYAPLGVAGPYNSLNVALSPAAPTVGADENADEMAVSENAAPFAVEAGWAGYHGLLLQVSADEPVTNAACTTIAQATVASDLDGQGWDFGQTRDNGSNTYVAGGLQVATTTADYFGKAAGYKAIDIALSQVGDLGIALANTSGSLPSLQLGVDLDGDTVQDGYLVWEETHYGANLWASNGILTHVPAFVGLPAEPGGGSPVSGTIDQYLAAYPDARILSFGYSLGSGVIGSAVIQSITVGCTQYGFTLAPTTNITCSAIADGPVATQIASQGWDFSQTRDNGSNTFVDGGLHVATTSADYFGKAAGYRSIDIALSAVGDFAITYTGAQGVPPSLQLGVDLDDDGTQDGYLVSEQTYYGQNLWASNGILNHVPAFVGLPAEPGGGSAVSGTVDQYLAAYPDARILSFGYSLGSGVVGSATITSIVVGCTSYGFDGVIVAGSPTISGTPAVGQQLTAVPGTWSPADVALSYQWKSNGAPIPGATDSTYTLTAEEADDTIALVVTGAKTGYASVDATSPGVTVAKGALTTVTPTIVGEASIGSVLTAHPGAWGPSPIAFDYQWLSDGEVVPGATEVTYLITFSDAGHALSVRVTGTKTGYQSATLTSDPTITLPTNAVPAVDRLFGADRYATAVEISQAFVGGVDRVYLATGANYPDALSAAAAGGYLGAPVLLTTPTAVPDLVMDELDRLAPDEIVIVGSTSAVAASVAAQLADVTSDPDVTRIGGGDRYETSRMIAAEAFPAGATSAAYVATGLSFPDALAAGPAAAHFDGPVILVNGTAATADAATLAALAALGVDEVKIAGGSAAVSAGIAARLATDYTVTRNQGANRFGTAIAINEDEFETAPTIYLATGLSFPDALAGAALAGHTGAPLYVSLGECIPEAVYESIIEMNPGRIVLLGGLAALGEGIEDLDMC